jgi:hypothetical protein
MDGDKGGLIDFQNETCAHEALKTFGVGLHAIVADGEFDQDEIALGIGVGGTGIAGFDLRDRDGSGCDGSAARIKGGSAQSGGDLLGASVTAKSGKKPESEENPASQLHRGHTPFYQG